MAPTAKPHCMPPTVASRRLEPSLTRAPDLDEETVTTTATPMAPATCCTVPRIDDAVRVQVRGHRAEAQREHRREDSASETISDQVRGQHVDDRGVGVDLGEQAESDQDADRAGDDQRPPADLVEGAPTRGPSSPIARPPGIISMPVCSTVSSRTCCR